MSSCEKDRVSEEVSQLPYDIPVEMVDEVTLGVLHEMRAFDMEVNEGNTPPNLEGKYRISPLSLICSNVAGDVYGCNFEKIDIAFSNQSNATRYHTVDIEYHCGPEHVTGVKAYIVGNDNKFTVMAKVTLQGDYYPVVYICAMSGEITPYGIVDTHIVRFMLENNGDPGNCLLKKGEGRMLYDQDGYSEKLSD